MCLNIREKVNFPRKRQKTRVPTRVPNELFIKVSDLYTLTHTRIFLHTHSTVRIDFSRRENSACSQRFLFWCQKSAFCVIFFTHEKFFSRFFQNHSRAILVQFRDTTFFMSSPTVLCPVFLPLSSLWRACFSTMCYARFMFFLYFYYFL